MFHWDVGYGKVLVMILTQVFSWGACFIAKFLLEIWRTKCVGNLILTNVQCMWNWDNNQSSNFEGIIVPSYFVSLVQPETGKLYTGNVNTWKLEGFV
jgi:hypothetical protein